MTVKELLETTDYDLYQISNPDYRGCKLMNKNNFIKYYNGTDTYKEEIKNYNVDYFQCSTYCSILLGRDW